MAAAYNAPWAMVLAVMLAPSARAIKIAVDPASPSDLAIDLASRMTANKETVAKEMATKEMATKGEATEATSWSQDVSWVIAANSPGQNSQTLAANVMDGDFGTIWNSEGNDSCQTHCNNWWIEFDIGSAQTMSGIRITNMGDYSHDATVVELATAAAQGGPWNTPFITLNLVHSTDAMQEFEIDPGVTLQHIRLRVTDTAKPQGYQPYIREVLFQLGETTTSATGDPHLQNMHGQRFDLMRSGEHVLINIPHGVRPEDAVLRVVAVAHRSGEACADMYFQRLNVTGLWAEARQAGGYHYDSHSVVKESPEWVAVGKVEIKIVHGQTQAGVRYLNFYVKHLGRAGFPVGGLLGEDDYQDVATPPAGCEKRVALRAMPSNSSRGPSIAIASLS